MRFINECGHITWPCPLKRSISDSKLRRHGSNQYTHCDGPPCVLYLATQRLGGSSVLLVAPESWEEPEGINGLLFSDCSLSLAGAAAFIPHGRFTILVLGLQLYFTIHTYTSTHTHITLLTPDTRHFSH